MVPSGVITKQVGEQVYALVGLKPDAAPRTYAPGAPHWLKVDDVKPIEAPMIEAVPEGFRVARSVAVPLPDGTNPEAEAAAAAVAAEVEPNDDDE
jgi:hypothetical protein